MPTAFDDHARIEEKDRHAMNFPDLRLSQNAQFHQAHSPFPLDGGMLQLLNCRKFWKPFSIFYQNSIPVT